MANAPYDPDAFRDWATFPSPSPSRLSGQSLRDQLVISANPPQIPSGVNHIGILSNGAWAVNTDLGVSTGPKQFTMGVRIVAITNGYLVTFDNENPGLAVYAEDPVKLTEIIVARVTGKLME